MSPAIPPGTTIPATQHQRAKDSRYSPGHQTRPSFGEAPKGTSQGADRGGGALQFGSPIAFHLQCPPRASGYVLKTHCIQFDKIGSAVQARLHLVHPSGGPTRWRVAIQLVNHSGDVLARAAAVLENSGTINYFPWAIGRDLHFYLGQWEKVRGASGFEASVRPLPGAEGGLCPKVISVEGVLDLDVRIPAGIQWIIGHGHWVEFTDSGGKIQGKLRVTGVSPGTTNLARIEVLGPADKVLAQSARVLGPGRPGVAGDEQWVRDLLFPLDARHDGSGRTRFRVSVGRVGSGKAADPAGSATPTSRGTRTTGPSQDDDVAWGEVVGGIQVGIRAEKKVWRGMYEPFLIAKVRNTATRAGEAGASRKVRRVEIEVDGVWYRSVHPPLRGLPKRLVPEESTAEMPIILTDRWRDDRDMMLNLAPGKHTARLAAVSSRIRAISNLVEIAVTPAPPGQPASRTVPRLQFRLVALEGERGPAETMPDPRDRERTVRVLKTILFGDADVESIPDVSSFGGLTMLLTDPAAAKFAQFASGNAGRRLAIVFNGELLLVPVIRPQTGKKLSFSGRLPRRAGFRLLNLLSRPPASRPSTRTPTRSARVGQH